MVRGTMAYLEACDACGRRHPVLDGQTAVGMVRVCLPFPTLCQPRELAFCNLRCLREWLRRDGGL